MRSRSMRLLILTLGIIATCAMPALVADPNKRKSSMERAILTLSDLREECGYEPCGLKGNSQTSGWVCVVDSPLSAN